MEGPTDRWTDGQTGLKQYKGALLHAPEHVYERLCPLDGWSVTHSFDNPRVVLLGLALILNRKLRL